MAAALIVNGEGLATNRAADFDKLSAELLKIMKRTGRVTDNRAERKQPLSIGRFKAQKNTGVTDIAVLLTKDAMAVRTKTLIDDLLRRKFF